MRPVFKHNTLRETSGSSKRACTSKYNHKSNKIRRKARRGRMRRRRLCLQHKKKHLPPNNVKVVIERDTLRRIVGNYTLRSVPNISRKKKKKALISVDVEEWVSGG
jgi:hypothetical protein